MPKILLFAFLLVGCDVSENDQENVYIERMSILSRGSIDDFIIVDPYIDAGRFEVLATVGKPRQGFTFELFASKKPTYFNAAKIYEQRCLRGDSCYEAPYLAVQCRLNADVTINCGKFPAIDISSQISNLPSPAYIVVKVCHANVNVCDNQNISVFLR